MKGSHLEPAEVHWFDWCDESCFHSDTPPWFLDYPASPLYIPRLPPPLSASHVSVPAGCILSVFACVCRQQPIRKQHLPQLLWPPHVPVHTFLSKDAHEPAICNHLIRPFWGLSLVLMLKLRWIVSLAPSVFYPPALLHHWDRAASLAAFVCF